MNVMKLDGLSYKVDQLCALLSLMNLQTDIDDTVNHSLISLAFDLSVEASNILSHEQKVTRNE